MVHKLTGNPIQLDFGYHTPVEGATKSLEQARTSAEAMRSAGLSDEADIFEGVINELLELDGEGRIYWYY